MPWDVVDLKVIAPLALLVRFSDGISGEVRFESSHLTRVFSALKEFNFLSRPSSTAARSLGLKTLISPQTRCTTKSRRTESGSYASSTSWVMRSRKRSINPKHSSS